MRPPSPVWARSPERAALRAVYAEADALLSGWACRCSRAPVPPGASADTPCCHFAVTGREPYPTAIELEEVRHGMRVAGLSGRDRRHLPLAELRACPLLSPEGRCRIYDSRPLGCRTFFCDEAEGPAGPRDRLPRAAANALGRRIADLSARFDPLDPRPRPMVRALLGGR